MRDRGSVALLVLALSGCGERADRGTGSAPVPSPSDSPDGAATVAHADGGAATGAPAERGPSTSLCTPGQQVACDCAGGTATGVQLCDPDGVSFGSCAGCPAPPPAPTTPSPPSCVKKTCADEIAKYDAVGGAYFHVCGKTPDECGGYQQCPRACLYGACATQNGGTDFCNCGSAPASNLNCINQGLPSTFVACQPASTAALPGCVQFPGLANYFCCP